jgi:hypothetical protein
MRSIICLTTALLLCAGSAHASAGPDSDSDAAAKPAAFQINETSWTYTDDGVKKEMSVDAKGNYIENSAEGKHLDHGTSLMKGDKVCFTSAMTKEGQVCWTTKPVEIGQSMDTVSDKGKKLTVNRVAYSPLSMPK